MAQSSSQSTVVLDPPTTPNKTVNILGFHIDAVSLGVFSVAIVLWMAMWRFTALRGIQQKNPVVNWAYYGVLIFFVVSILISDTRTFDYHEEEGRLDIIKQYAAIVGTMVLAMALFSDQLTRLLSAGRTRDYFIMMFSSLILTVLPLLYVSFHKTAKSMRTVRKIKQACYDMGIGVLLALFLYALKDVADSKTMK